MNKAEMEQFAIEKYGHVRTLDEVSEEELREAVTECKTFAGVRARLGLSCCYKQLKRHLDSFNIDCIHLGMQKCSRYELFSKNDIIDFFKASKSFSELAEHFGYSYGTNIHNLHKWAIEEGYDFSHFVVNSTRGKKRKQLYSSRNELQNIVSQCHTFTEVSCILETSINSVHRLLDRMEIDYSHFDAKHYLSNRDIFINGKDINDVTLRNALAKLGIATCELCNNEGIWNGEPLLLQIHHKNGHHNDNRIDNLMLLCPTCHAQIENRGTKDHAYSKIKEDRYNNNDGRFCERCRNDLWNDGLIPLEVHHKDGNHYNDSNDNIEILCPNCHTQTETFSNKGNRGNIVSDADMKQALEQHDSVKSAFAYLHISYSKHARKRAHAIMKKHNIVHRYITDDNIDLIIDCIMSNQVEYLLEKNVSPKNIVEIINGNHRLSPVHYQYPLVDVALYTPQLQAALHLCSCCHKYLPRSGQQLCQKCNKRKRPTRQELKNLIRIYPFVKIGRMFSVTGNAVVKWCKEEYLPWRKIDILSFSDEEWDKLDVFLPEQTIDKLKPNEQEIIDIFMQTRSYRKTGQILECSPEYVATICKRNIPNCNPVSPSRENIPLIAIDKNTGEKIHFCSQFEAAQWLIQNEKTKSPQGSIRTRIIKMIERPDSSRQTAYGYYWKRSKSK